MGKPGFMLYNEDSEMLKCLDDTTLASMIRSLIDTSRKLEETGEIEPFNSGNKLYTAIFNSMVQKLIRDSLSYAETSKERAIAAKMKHIQETEKGISKQEARKRAEEEYMQKHPPACTSAQMHPNCNNNLSVSGTVSEPNGNPSVDVSVTPAVAVAGAVATATTVTPFEQVCNCAQTQGVRITDRVKELLLEELNKSDANAVCSKIIVEGSFLQRLKLLGGTA